MALWEYLGAWSAITQWLYRLNWNANDSSWNSRNMTTSWVSYVDGLFWQCLQQGASSYAMVSNNMWWNGSVNFTVSLRINVSSRSVSWVKTVFAIRETTNSTNFAIYYNSSLFYAGKSRRAVQDAPTISTWTIPTWVRNNIVITYNTSWTVSSIYLNWVLATSASRSGNWTGETLNETILWSITTNGSSPEKFDEVIIENRAWTAIEVQKYYTYARGRFWI